MAKTSNIPFAAIAQGHQQFRFGEIWWRLVVALLAIGAGAQAAPPVGAGGQFQQIPPAPEPQASIPDIRIERGDNARNAGPAGPKVLVRLLRVTGETLFSEATLIAATGSVKPNAFGGDFHNLLGERPDIDGARSRVLSCVCSRKQWLLPEIGNAAGAKPAPARLV